MPFYVKYFVNKLAFQVSTSEATDQRESKVVRSILSFQDLMSPRESVFTFLHSLFHYKIHELTDNCFFASFPY